MPRPLYVIAHDIRQEWENPHFAARPYLHAMAELTSISDRYLLDSGRSIVLYFLSNAATFRGEAARRLKAELKSHLNAAR